MWNFNFLNYIIWYFNSVYSFHFNRNLSNKLYLLYISFLNNSLNNFLYNFLDLNYLLNYSRYNHYLFNYSLNLDDSRNFNYFLYNFFDNAWCLYNLLTNSLYRNNFLNY